MIVKNSPITEGLEAFDIVNLLSCQSKHKYVLLDIETTGFTPKNSQLYMIGCIHFSENSSLTMETVLTCPISQTKNLSANASKRCLGRVL